MAEIEKIGILKENWDRIRVIPPICYFPPIWEVVLDRGIDEMANEIAAMGPRPEPWVIAKHMKDRIDLVEKLVDTEKLDPKIGDIAKRHFETHLNEIKAIQTKQG
jgi:hypothetical protein